MKQCDDELAVAVACSSVVVACSSVVVACSFVELPAAGVHVYAVGSTLVSLRLVGRRALVQQAERQFQGTGYRRIWLDQVERVELAGQMHEALPTRSLDLRTA